MVKRPSTWPRREIRRRLGEVSDSETYGRHYGLLSALSHPTAQAVSGGVVVADGLSTVELFRTEPDPERLRTAAVFIAANATFTCFALVNAGPKEAVEPAWRLMLKDLASEVFDLAEGSGPGFDHLEEDWDSSQTRWAEIVSRLGAATELGESLDTHPASWRRAARELDQGR